MPLCCKTLLFWTFLLLASGSSLPGFSQSGKPRFETDSAVMTCYRQCRARMREPQLPAMCDTLYAMAATHKDTHMQLVSLCLKVDYYYYRNDRENLQLYVDRVKEFCRRSGNRDFLYFYYFVWSGRLITYYIKQNQGNIAVYESRKMLAEAQADNYPRGIADCHRVLANLYLTQSNYPAAMDNFRREIEIIESNGIHEVNLPTQYASMAQCALELNMPDSAYLALCKARSLPLTPYQTFTVNKAFVLYYLDRKDYAAAARVLADTEQLFQDSARELENYRSGLYYLRSEYYRATGQYREALETIAASKRDTTLHTSGYLDSETEAKLADIYWRMGDMGNAARHYREYFEVVDSVRTREIQNATADFSGLLEIERLQNETRALQLSAERRRLQVTLIVLLSVLVSMVAIGLFALRIMKLNRKLKSSEAIVVEQNRKLLDTQSELRYAKELAEHASHMKSAFIQNMSHEIRTPLNSVVGFSQVLAAIYRDDTETVEYASIIERASSNLLRLVDDVLDIASLDQSGDLPAYPDFQDIHSCCQISLSKVESEVREGVTLIFEGMGENRTVYMNSRRICQVLTHLLHNAAKFTSEGQISLSCRFLSEQNRVRYIVTDTGPGIPADQYSEVFERFVKLDSFIPGTGLGLPICRIIAQKLGGSLRIDPTYTGGCRMIFEVPVNPELGSGTRGDDAETHIS